MHRPLIIKQEKLRKVILSRLKTQERAYKSINIYYTPRLYAKLVKVNSEHMQTLAAIYNDLADRVEIGLINNEVVKLYEIKEFRIEQLQVYARLFDGRKIQLHNFEVPAAKSKHITIDLTVPFFYLINSNSHQLPAINKLTEIIRLGRDLNKEEMRKEYTRVHAEFPAADIDLLLNELKLLAGLTKLKLMPAQENYSKGKKTN
jgi:hypothetical protein